MQNSQISIEEFKKLINTNDEQVIDNEILNYLNAKMDLTQISGEQLSQELCIIMDYAIEMGNLHILKVIKESFCEQDEENLFIFKKQLGDKLLLTVTGQTLMMAAARYDLALIAYTEYNNNGLVISYNPQNQYEVLLEKKMIEKNLTHKNNSNKAKKVKM
jgi:hypothetical protein